MGAPTESQEEAIQGYLAAERNRQALSKARGGGCVGNLIKVIGILVLALAFAAGADYVDAPWSWGLFGQPTLTGEWVGTFTLPAGQHGAAYLNLTHDHNFTRDVRDSYSIHNLPPFNGTAQGCIGKGGVQAYSLYGGATSDGRDVEMVLQAQKPTVPNYALHELKGSWNEDKLTLAGTLTTILDSQGSTLSKSEPNQSQPTTIAFHRGGQADFEIACRTLG